MTVSHQARGLLRAAPRTGGARWIAVTGGKGGVGKTLLAVQLALGAARAGRRTLLVDADPGLGNVGVHLRLAPQRTLDDVLLGRCRARDAMLPGPGGLELIAGASGSPALGSAGPAALAELFAAVAAAAAAHDVVICDTGAGIGPAVIEAVRRADVTLAVTTPDAAAVTDCYALCKVLQAERIAVPRLVVNRVRSRDDALRTAARLTTVCTRFLGCTPELHGWLHDERSLELAVAAQRPWQPQGAAPAADDLRALIASMLSLLPAKPR